MKPRLRTYWLGLGDQARRDILAEVVEQLSPDRLDAALAALEGVAHVLVERVVREHRRDVGDVQSPPAQAPTLRSLGLALEYATGATLPDGADREQLLEVLLDGHVVEGKQTDEPDRVVLRGRGRHRHVGAIAARLPADPTRLVVITVDTRRHRFGA